MANKLYLKLTSPFADDLTLISIHGEERLSAPFHFTMELRSKKSSLDFKKILGKAVTVTIGIESKHRYINGLVTRFVQGGTHPDETIYFAEIRPWFWMLTLTRDSRIFQNKSASDIIKAVFGDYGFEKHKLSLKGTPAKRDYCVQHQESDYDFVSRLMEEEGIFYFFDHTDSDHTMVLGDDSSVHKPCPTPDPTFSGVSTAFAVDVIKECSIEEQVTTNAYTMGDFNFETPKTQLRSQVKGKSPALAIYEYPGGFMKKDAGDAIVKKRIEAQEEPGKSLRGQSRVRGLIAGFTFTISDHPRDDVNDDYVVRWISHSANLEHYSNSFEALPADVTFRPPVVTRRPRIAGSETATVVGKAGEEIWTDKYGRVKVHFPWDRLGSKDDKSSCWIRVSQNWAGKQWGNFFLPRIGQEVIVTFIDGDPDRPLITGAVYNADQTVPYALPANQTRSTMKSNSSKGGSGFNELRFEDKKGKEEIFIHAQKHLNVKVLSNQTHDIHHDDTWWIGNQRKTLIKLADDILTLKEGNRTTTIEKGNDSLKVKGTRDEFVEGDVTVKHKGNFEQDVDGNYTLKVKGNLEFKVTGNVSILAGGDITMKSDMNIKSKAGIEINSEATMVTVKASGQGTIDGGGMLTVKGGMVKIN